jgi:hypothetical protein
VQELSRRVAGYSERDQDSSSGRAAPSYYRKAANELVGDDERVPIA